MAAETLIPTAANVPSVHLAEEAEVADEVVAAEAAAVVAAAAEVVAVAADAAEVAAAEAVAAVVVATEAHVARSTSD